MSDNRNQAIIMAVGVGAVGTILAYLGYSIFSDESNKENTVEVNDDIGEEMENKESLLTTEIEDNINNNNVNKNSTSIFYNFFNSTFKKNKESTNETSETELEKYNY